MDNFKEKLDRFFRSIYGVDSLSRFLLVISLFSMIIRNIANNRQVEMLLNILINLCFIIILFRMFSRNMTARSSENFAFLKKTKPIRREWELLKLRIENKDVAYVKCPECKQIAKLPKNSGKVKIHCKNCGNDFVKNV